MVSFYSLIICKSCEGSWALPLVNSFFFFLVKFTPHLVLIVSYWLIEDSEYGAVTAVDILESSEYFWLVCGHENGHIVLWDIATGKTYQTL